MRRYEIEKKKISRQFFRKVFACITGIVILLLIVSTYRNYVVREGKAPYLTLKELLPQLNAFQTITGSDIYGEITSDEVQMEQEYITVGTVKRILLLFPDVDASVLDAYKKDTWYVGVRDWNIILLDIVRQYGEESLFAVELTLIGDENGISDVSGTPIMPEQVLTDKGIMNAVYWNTNAYLYSRVLAVCYGDQILSVIRYSEETGKLVNVYLVETSEAETHFFFDNYHMRYGIKGTDLYSGSVVDLEFKQGKIVVDEKETEIVHGKLLQVSDTGIEIEGYGVFVPSDDMKVYRLYGELESMSTKELRIGYSFTDFVLFDGKVAACLMIKEEDMEYIRVLLKGTDYAGRYHDNFHAICDQDYEIIYYENGVEIGRESKTAGEAIAIEATTLNRGVKRIKLMPKVLSAKTTVQSIKRSQGTPVYKGTIEITGSEEGLLLVNEVLLEDYLCTVVPSEMPASYPKEALMAQAICARTYAYGKMIKTGLPQLGAHVDDSAGFQVYNNIMEQYSTTEAVKATHNMVAVYNGEPIGTYYYSTSCGAGTDSSIWHGGGEIPSYLQAIMIEDTVVNADEQDESEKEVNLATTPQSLMDESVFREWIQRKNMAHFEAEEGWYRWNYSVKELDAEYMYSVLQKRYENNPNLILTKDENGEFVSQPITQLEYISNIEIIKRLPGGVADELLITGSNAEGIAEIKVISELNIRYVLADGVTKVVRQSGDEVSAIVSIPSAYIIIDLEKNEDKVIGYRITGGGFGHGVGMSQNGAKNMAERGMPCEEIIGFFYPGVELKTLQFGE